MYLCCFQKGIPALTNLYPNVQREKIRYHRRMVTKDFKNALGKFTPCFADIVILGLAHLTAVVLCALRLHHLLRDRTVPKFALGGFTRWMKASQGVAALASLLIVLFQLQVRSPASGGSGGWGEGG